MNNRTLSALALAVALVVSSAAANAQSTADPLPEASNDVTTEQPESYEDTGSGTTKAVGSGSDATPGVTDDMQAMVDELIKGQQDQALSGDEASACEAIICLSTGSPPGECAASLRRYFSINLSKPWKTIEARINFLKMCPAASFSPQMGTLVEALGNGAGRCDAATLNQTLRIWTGPDSDSEIGNQMPSYCDAYFTHEYTDIGGTKPRYIDKFVVRTYEDYDGNIRYEYGGGYWVDGGSTEAVASNTGNGAVPASKDPAAIGF
jgi:hypothetical protein